MLKFLIQAVTEFVYSMLLQPTQKYPYIPIIFSKMQCFIYSLCTVLEDNDKDCIYYNCYNLPNDFDIKLTDPVPVESMNVKGGYNCSIRSKLLDLSLINLTKDST